MSQLPTEYVDEHDDEIDLRELANTLWLGRYTILSAIGVGLMVSVIYLHIATYTYTATLVLVPTQSQTQSPASHFAGLASLAGINLGQGESISPFMEYPNVLTTKEVAEDLIEHSPKLMNEIKRSPRLAGKIFGSQWDARTKNWKEPQSLLRPIVDAAKFVLGVPVNSWHPPGSAELQAFIAKNVSTSEDTEKPILTLSFSASDPVFAKLFLAELNGSTDRVLRRISLDRSSKYAAYLEKKLASVQTTDLRQVLMESLSAQETLIMMGSSDTSFAVQEIGGPATPIRPDSPKPLLVILLGMLLGAILGSMLTFGNVSPLEHWKTLASRVRGFRISWHT